MARSMHEEHHLVDGEQTERGPSECLNSGEEAALVANAAEAFRGDVILQK